LSEGLSTITIAPLLINSAINHQPNQYRYTIITSVLRLYMRTLNDHRGAHYVTCISAPQSSSSSLFIRQIFRAFTGKTVRHHENPTPKLENHFGFLEQIFRSSMRTRISGRHTSAS